MWVKSELKIIKCNQFSNKCVLHVHEQLKLIAKCANFHLFDSRCSYNVDFDTGNGMKIGVIIAIKQYYSDRRNMTLLPVRKLLIVDEILTCKLDKNSY